MLGIVRMLERLHVRWVTVPALAGFLVFGACRQAEDDETILLEESAEDTIGVATYWDDAEQLSAEDLERGRLDPSWREAPSIDSLLASLRDTLGLRSRTLRLPSDTIAMPAVPDSLDLPVRLPLEGDAPGRSVLAVQILLDRSAFSPGVIDGRWGKNTEKAVFWLQRSAGLDPTGVVDSTTFAWIYELAGRPESLLVSHTLTADDVAGPFVDLPEDVYARAELECLCYESLAEKLAERFHATPDLLAELNPGVALDSLSVSDSLAVPAVDGAPVAAADSIAELVISDQGRYLHALDRSGRILFHFPTTLGSRYEPSSTSGFAVRSVTWDPWFHYQPELLEGVPDTDRPTRLPPGPNSPVGIVWIDLTVEHYGIHGTAAPATIGYATSSGCVRLSNWDAAFLAEQVQPGTPVGFRDIDEVAPADTTREIARSPA
jgi:lipoprotein-anchoring transpeptidase ErfK/SrfK